MNDARRRGHSWSLDLEYFREIVIQPCHFCGEERGQVSMPGTFGEFRYTGIDRWNSRRGYKVGNVVPACGPCNRMKSVLGGREFIRACKRIARYAKEGNTRRRDRFP